MNHTNQAIQPLPPGRSPSKQRQHTFKHWLGAAIAAVLLSACGGGGDQTTAAPSAVAWAEGPITGLGSIIVNGVRYDDSQARVERDDDNSVQSSNQLKLGMMVELQSSRPDDSTNRASASVIRFGSEIVGPIASVNAAASTLVVLGQTIEIKSNTVFDDSLTGGFAGLTSGQVVEIHALLDGTTGNYVATRIEDKVGATVFRLRGLVSNLDTTAKTFSIGSAVISYANVAAADVPSNLANGNRVRVQLQTTQVNGQWVATAVRSGVKRVADFNDAKVRGLVSAFTSPQSFEVNGLKVDASAATFEPNAAAVVLGARVEVKGKMVNGVLVATKVELEGEGNRRAWRETELHGAVSALDTTAKTFLVREVKVDYSAVTEWKDGTAADLANGKSVEVKGEWSADRLTLKASKVEFES